MKITRERKIFGAVLVIALGWLAYDQLGGSKETTEAADPNAAADSLLVASTSTSGKTGAAASSQPTIRGDETSLAERLVKLASATIPANQAGESRESRDIFRPAGTWLVASDNGEGYRQIDPARFAQMHHLSAVSTSGAGGAVAAVDGKLLHIGAKIDGFKLVSIDRQTACFRAADGTEARLKLTGQVASGQ